MSISSINMWDIIDMIKKMVSNDSDRVKHGGPPCWPILRKTGPHPTNRRPNSPMCPLGTSIQYQRL